MTKIRQDTFQLIPALLWPSKVVKSASSATKPLWWTSLFTPNTRWGCYRTRYHGTFSDRHWGYSYGVPPLQWQSPKLRGGTIPLPVKKKKQLLYQFFDFSVANLFNDPLVAGTLVQAFSRRVNGICSTRSSSCSMMNTGRQLCLIPTKRTCEFLEVDGAWLVQGISGRLGLRKEEPMVGQFVCVLVREVG